MAIWSTAFSEAFSESIPNPEVAKATLFRATCRKRDWTINELGAVHGGLQFARLAWTEACW